MTVKQLIEQLSKYPAETEVWYIDDFYGEPSRTVEEYDIVRRNDKLIIGYV